MKLALMQPYLFPYIGYFQLVAVADRFVFYDDVNFIKNGWINRNRIHVDGQAHHFTVPLEGASPFQPILAVRVAAPAMWRRKLLELLRHQYRKAPHFTGVMDLVEDVLAFDSPYIADLARASVQACARHLGLATDFAPTSRAYGNATLRGATRVLDICRREGADEYWNLPGGRALYDSAEFADHGVALRFIRPLELRYPQGRHAFVPQLSIIDVLMYNRPEDVRERMLDVGHDCQAHAELTGGGLHG